MRIYLDVSCLNRPFDDQQQLRIRLETAAITLIFERIDAGEWNQIASQMSVVEVKAIRDLERRFRVLLLLPDTIIEIDDTMFQRAAELEKIGFKPADAMHVAAAEKTESDVFLSCDDRLCRLAKRRKDLKVRVANPVEWLKDIQDVNT